MGILTVDGRQGLAINRLLLKLSKSKGSKSFHVIDTKGYKRKFSARGIEKLFTHFDNKCGVAIP